MEHWSWQGVELRARAPGCWNDGIVNWRLSIIAVASLRRTNVNGGVPEDGDLCRVAVRPRYRVQGCCATRYATRCTVTSR